MSTLGKQLSIYSLGVIALIVIVGLIKGNNILVMFEIGVSVHSVVTKLYLAYNTYTKY